MPNSAITTPVNPNKNLYNGGSEWQNDFSDMPDFYQTYYRNYDPNLGRFLGVDPMAEATDYLTVYHYSGNNPVMFNDPVGNLRNTYGRQIYYSAVPPSGTSETNPEGWAAWDYQNGVIDTYRFGEIIGYYKEKRDREERTGEISLYDEKGGGLFDLAEFARFLSEARAIQINEQGIKVWYQSIYTSANPEYGENNRNTYPVIFNVRNTSKIYTYQSLAKSLYNSYIGRQIIPDAFVISVGGAGVYGVGGSHALSLVSLNRGPDAGLYLMSTTAAFRLGYQADIGVNFGMGYYTGPGDVTTNATLATFTGKGFDVNGDIIVGAGIWGSLDNNNSPTWIGISVSIGESIGGSGGTTNTEMLKVLIKY